MKLLYLYINDRESFPKFEINFTSQYRFTLNHDLCRFSLEYSDSKDKIPYGFFTVTNKEKCISSVSIVVGACATGKTSIARYLYHIRYAQCGYAKFDYVLVYEKGNRWHVQWYLRENADSDKSSDLKMMPPPSRIGAWVIGKYVDDKMIHGAQSDFEFAYYSPHFTTESQLPNNNPAVDNLSSNGIMYGGFETRQGRSYGYSDQGKLQRNYLAVEHRLGLEVLRKIEKQGLDLDIPNPSAVRIGVHDVEFEEDVSWLSVRKRNIELIGKDDKMYGWRNDKLMHINKLEDAVDKYKLLPTVFKRQDLVAQFFIVFLLVYVRTSGFFDFQHNILLTEYASRLLQTYSNVVVPYYRDKSWSRKIFYEKLVSALRENITRQGIKAGDVIESEGVVIERVAIADMFERLSKWCLEQYKHENSVVCELVVGMDRHKELASFFDNYVVAMQRFDFLSYTYDPPLSSGEMSRLSMYGRINDFIYRMREGKLAKELLVRRSGNSNLPYSLGSRSYSADLLLFMDEVETTQHPNMQREMIYDIIRFLENVDPQGSIHLIFATHSPMLLSDIPSGNVVYLEQKGKVGKIDGVHNTFGANIFDLYRYPFVLRDGTTGRFAKQKLDNAFGALCRRMRKRKNTQTRTTGISKLNQYVLEHMGDAIMQKYWKSLVKGGYI